MAGRALSGIMLAGAMAACSCSPGHGRETERPAAVAVSTGPGEPAKGPQTEATLRDSFQPCVDKAAGATWPMQDCIEAEFDYQDARLNKAYQALMNALPEARRVELRDRERQWLSSRDANCPWDDDTDGQGRRIESNYCVMERTALRADELEARLKDLGAPSD